VGVVDWSKAPDLFAVTLLTCAFASVGRRSQTPVSSLWLIGWIMIVLHFSASMFLPFPGIWGTLALIIALLSLIWAGFLFMWASVPFRKEQSSRWMHAVLMGTNTLYVCLLVANPAPVWILDLSAGLLGICPLAIAFATLRRFKSPLRWSTVCLYSALSIFLLLFQHRPDNGSTIALNAVLFTVYLGCCINFLYGYRRTTTGAFITLSGFLAWAAVFLVSPLMNTFLPRVRVENEVWNLPKYVVAVGMILLLLEKQIEHNKYLALHDELTGLPNRRLFQDRLASALERARRTGAQTALLLVDLDDFKRVNDTMGHHVGDLLLQHVGAIFSARVRRSDTVARTGGDEFCVILEDPISRGTAERVGYSLMQLIKQPLELGKHTVRIGASVGIAIFPEDASDVESLCIAADLRMYNVKHDSRSHVERGVPDVPSSIPTNNQQKQEGLQLTD